MNIVGKEIWGKGGISYKPIYAKLIYLFKAIDNFNQFGIIYFVTITNLLLFLNISNTKRWIPAGNTCMQGLFSLLISFQDARYFSPSLQ